jgi:inosine-uridine nucleoside N-ribohydrolase
MNFRVTIPNALAGLAQAAVAFTLAIALLILAASAPIHLAGIREDWQVAASLKTIGPVVSPQAFAVYILCLRYLVVAICFGAAALLLWRRPGRPMALLAALACALLPVAFNLGGYVEAWPYPAPWDGILDSARAALALIGLSSLLLLVYLFPDGRFSPRWLWLPAGLGVALMAGGLLVGDDGWAVVMAGMAFTLLVGGAGQIQHYRRADDHLRTQIKPVVIALVALPAILMLGFALGALLDTSPFAGYGALANLHLQLVPVGLLALALTWAVLGHGLWGEGEHSRRRSLRLTACAAGLAVVLAAGVPFGLSVWTARADAATTVLPAMRPVPLIVDTDLAHDDILALLFLAQHPSVNLQAVTVSGTGEVRCAAGVRNALAVLDAIGKGDIPVACGRETPLVGTHAFPDAWRANADDLYGVELPPSASQASALSASELLRATIRASNDKPAVLTLGPLTNLADALQTDPSLASKVQAVFIMGGAIRVEGNLAGSGTGLTNRVAEWNIWADPAAAEIVLRSGIPVVQVPLDATRHVPATVEFLQRLAADRGTPAAELACRILTANEAFIRSGGYQFWDVLTAALIADEHLARYQVMRLTVVQDDGPESGRTARVADGAPIRVATWADRTRFEDLFVRTLNR